MLMLLITTSAFAAPFEKGSVEAGLKLFQQSHCNRCHIEMKGGDGSEIFTRPDHKVKNPSQLIKQINVCGGNAGVTLTSQDEQNLAAYLNKYYYKFP